MTLQEQLEEQNMQAAAMAQTAAQTATQQGGPAQPAYRGPGDKTPPPIPTLNAASAATSTGRGGSPTPAAVSGGGRSKFQGIDDAVQGIHQTSGNLWDRFQNYENRNAPQATPTYVAPAANSGFVGRPGTSTMNAAQVAPPPTNMQAAQIGPNERAMTAQMQAVNANAAGPSTVAGAGKVAIDQSQQGDFRAGQRGLAEQLSGVVNGTAPSVAQNQMRQQTDANIANQYALAASARGGNIGAAQRSAMANAGALNQQAAGQASLLRAQESATARGQLGEVLGSGRGQDIGLATSQAGLSQQSNLADQGAMNASNMQATANQQQTNLANAGAGNAASQFNAGAQNANNQFNAGQSNATNLSQAGLNQAANATNFESGRTDARLNAGFGQGANQFNAGAANDMSKFGSQLEQQNNQFNAGQTNVVNGLRSQLEQGTSLANIRAQIDTMGLDDAQKRGLLNALLQSQGQGLGGEMGLYGARENNSNKWWDRAMQVLGAAGQVGAAAATGGATKAV